MKRQALALPFCHPFLFFGFSYCVNAVPDVGSINALARH
jgi:hypothetical protein